MAVTRSVLRSGTTTPPDVVLVAQVMNPSRATEERLVEPAQYAAAGVAHFWRLEPGGGTCAAHPWLEGRVYRETGRFSDEVVVARPVRLRFRLGELIT